MTARSTLLDDIARMDAEMLQLTGRTVFGYIACPTPSTERISFGDGSVHLSLAEAHEYMTALVLTARRDPGRLPWPLCEPVG